MALAVGMCCIIHPLDATSGGWVWLVTSPPGPCVVLFMLLIQRGSCCSVNAPVAASRAQCVRMCLPLILLSGLGFHVLAPDATCCNVRIPDATSGVVW